MHNEQPGGGTLLLVDVSYQCWRAAAAHPQLASRRAFTGGLYGFFTTVAKIARETDATRAVFCRDMRPYLRSRDYPQYKELRKANADEELRARAHETMELVLGALRACNLPTWEARGFESDDLIAHAVRKYRHRFARLWAASNDSDLHQLLFDCDRFAVYGGQGLADAMRADRLRAMLPGLTKSGWVTMQALQGTHNDIEGVRGIGPKKAYAAATTPAIMRTLRERHASLIERNERLIELPHRELPRSLQLPAAARPFDMRELYRYLAVYEIDTTASIERAFRRIGGER